MGREKSAGEYSPRDLIREVKKRPGIYDKDKLDHPKREHKQRLWMEVAEILTPQELFSEYTEQEKECRIDELQQKWKHLRDHFYSEIKLMESGQTKKRKYVYYDDMEFMRPFVGFKMLPINRTLNDKSIDFLYEELGAAEGGDVFEQTYEELGPEDYESELPSRGQKSTQPPSSSSRGFQDNSNGNKKQQNTAKSNSSSNAAIQLRDGDIAFCLSLVPSLRKMGDAKKLRAKIDLLKIVHRYVEHEERQARLSQYTKGQKNEQQQEVTLDSINPDDMIIEDHTEDDEASNIKIEEGGVDPLRGQITSDSKTWWK